MKVLAKIAIVGGLIMGFGAAASAGDNLCSNPLYSGLPACKPSK